MKKHGFTLIELLAVIAILAILVILAVPKVLQLFEDAKKNTFKVEAQNIIKAAEQGYTLSMLKGKTKKTTYTYDEYNKSKVGTIDLDLSNNIKDGAIIISSNGKVSLAIYKDDYCLKKGFDSKELSIEKAKSEECMLEETTSENCFDFNESTGTITDYYDYESNNSNNPECPTDVIIPKMINNALVTNLGEWSFSNTEITSVFIPSTVKEIEFAAFYTCVIDNLVISEGVESIGLLSFYECRNLETLVLPLSLKTIGGRAFGWNNKLSKIEIKNPETTIEDLMVDDNSFRDAFNSNGVGVYELISPGEWRKK